MNFIHSNLRGVGQVLFQNNIYTGVLFLIGIFINSWLLGLAALLGTLTSTLSAHFLKYPKEDIQNGLYGFNGTLTGIAVLCFFEVNLIAIIALIIGSFLSTILMRVLLKIIPPFTAPFVISTWLVFYVLLFIFNYVFISSPLNNGNTLDILSASSKSFGQVMFQNNIITGSLFLLGILINNRLMAIYAIYAACLGSLTGWIFQVDFSNINAGLMGYNAILCAIALTGKRRQDFFWITLAIVCSTVLNIGLGATGIITLTAPFVIVTWFFLKLKKVTFV